MEGNEYSILTMLALIPMFTSMAVHDTGDYTKYGPRELYPIFLAVLFAGFLAGHLFGAT